MSTSPTFRFAALSGSVPWRPSLVPLGPTPPSARPRLCGPVGVLRAIEDVLSVGVELGLTMGPGVIDVGEKGRDLSRWITFGRKEESKLVDDPRPRFAERTPHSPASRVDSFQPEKGRPPALIRSSDLSDRSRRQETRQWENH